MQTVLLLAAADDTGELDVLRRAAAGLGLDEAGPARRRWTPGCSSATRTSLSVRHPLVRSAIYQAATGRGPAARAPGPRRGAGRSRGSRPGGLAPRLRRRGTGPGGGRPPWSSSGPGHSDAAGTSPRSRRTNERRRSATDPAQRAELTFAAARSAWACGRAGQAQALLSAAREAATDPLLLCDIARLRGHIEVNLGSAAEAHRIFVEAAQAVYPFDPARALDIGVAAAVMRTFGADSGTPLPVDRRPGGTGRRRLLRGRGACDTCWSR